MTESGETTERALVLLSGGIVSSALAAQVVEAYGKDNVASLTLKYGQQNEKQEAQAAADVAGSLGITWGALKVPNVFNKGTRTPDNVWHPEGTPVLRNAMLVVYGAMVAATEAVPTLFLGTDVDSTEADDAVESIAALTNMVSVATSFNVRLRTPILYTAYAEVCGYAIAHGLPLASMRTCAAWGANPCGVCAKCERRIRTLARFQFNDTVEYAMSASS